MLDTIEGISSFVDVMRAGPGSTKLILSAQRALTQLIMFCTKSQDLDPLTRLGVPILRHQQLLLETRVQYIVIKMVSIPFRECTSAAALYSLCELEQPANAELRRMCALAYRLLKQMVYGSPSFALCLAEFIPFMQSQLRYCRLAADTLSEMFHNNQRLLEQMPEPLVTCFVQLCTDRARQAGQIKLLSELCVCNAQGIAKNQSVICKHLLEENSRILLPLQMKDNKVQVSAPADGERGGSAHRPRPRSPRAP